MITTLQLFHKKNFVQDFPIILDMDVHVMQLDD